MHDTVSYHIMLFILNESFIIQNVRTDYDSYFITMLNRTREKRREREKKQKKRKV